MGCLYRHREFPAPTASGQLHVIADGKVASWTSPVQAMEAEPVALELACQRAMARAPRGAAPAAATRASCPTPRRYSRRALRGYGCATRIWWVHDPTSRSRSRPRSPPCLTSSPRTLGRAHFRHIAQPGTCAPRTFSGDAGDRSLLARARPAASAQQLAPHRARLNVLGLPVTELVRSPQRLLRARSA